MELLRNGFGLDSKNCEEGSLFYRTTITVDFVGEYQCRVHFPGDESMQPLASERRNLVVLGKNRTT